MDIVDMLKKQAYGSGDEAYDAQCQLMQIGNECFENESYPKAIEIFEEIERCKKFGANNAITGAMSNLAQIYEIENSPYYNRRKAIEYSKYVVDNNPNGLNSKIRLGLLYCEGKGEQHNPEEGKQLILEAYQQLIDMDGNDEYLSAAQCLQIGSVFCSGDVNANKMPRAADLEQGIGFLEKAKARWGALDESNREFKKLNQELLNNAREHLQYMRKIKNDIDSLKKFSQ